MIRTTLCVLSLLASSLCAQLAPPIYPGKIGFSIRNTTASTSAGDLCSGFTCTPHKLDVKVGHQLDFAVRTNLNKPFVLLVHPGNNGSPCISLPAFGNQWAGGTFIALIAATNKTDTIRCWGGLFETSLIVPSTVKTNDSVMFQVLAENGSSGAVFSSPVRVSVSQ